ncbi:hypothetical protein [Saccharibacillus alkalitolerans]|uniref:Uncharacterized protein n=1 Tax=Saccharibacillus alkalitolerans TaxID=2705290 RepID=A0ABX0F3U7_9BACL|nr:hypothetical protein [Saccharibacillus alkalitolerans]NGZ75317.1 hypothetical protein [Saccharibacillus alkalitolerans]
MIKTVLFYIVLNLLLIPFYVAGWFLGISAFVLAPQAYTGWDMFEIYVILLIPNLLLFVYIFADGFKRGFSRKMNLGCMLFIAALLGVGVFQDLLQFGAWRKE